ncbi:hypothetical protein PLEOSDRAFT_1067649 [Pleurotus ostreatus PC15]|uniref:Checkpoint protein n=1 Tax=Pleurotus ostreatus (strain PC15) TaxID=1137138 RepID=A0A067NA89_PLEO1|nr:hypothetical protein PLEOSDRAFT_1067649 [Pleurotus ostreatus PC15]
MRFRTSISSPQTFFRIIQAIEKLQKKCIIKFSDAEMRVICNNDANEGGIQVWSVIKVDSVFTNYRIQSNANNEITVLLSAEALLSALKSASTTAETADGDDVVLKLAKKNDQAVLCFEINGTTRLGKSMRVSHDVKIEVMKPTDVASLKEPMCPDPDVHILLPPLQKLRTVVERLKPMSDVLAVSASHSGSLKLSISTDSVKLDTEWRNCTIPKMTREPTDRDDENDHDPGKHFPVLVSTRSFLKFLNSHVVSTTTIACICQRHCMILYVYVGDYADAGGVLTFYIPAIIDGDD